MYSLSIKMPSIVEPGDGVLLKLDVAPPVPSDCKASLRRREEAKSTVNL